MSARLQIAYFTGQSDPGRCCLSPEQTLFLRELAGPERALVYQNFPYIESPPYRETSLLAASWNNFSLFLRSHSRHFRATWKASVQKRIDQAEHTLFLTGSCGLELYNNLYLPYEYERRCTLVCYGPVAARPPRFAASHFIQGEQDLISRLCFPYPARIIPANHLNYLTQPCFAAYCRRVLDGFPLPCNSTFG